MTGAEGLDAREATAALREGTAERLALGFGRLVEAAAGAEGQARDPRDAMIGLAPFLDCARRLGLDPAAVLGPIASTAPAWYRETFDAFVRRTDVTLAAFGWTVIETPDGPAYRFSWDTARPMEHAGPTQ
jgi:hypothetical protein